MALKDNLAVGFGHVHTLLDVWRRDGAQHYCTWPRGPLVATTAYSPCVFRSHSKSFPPPGKITYACSNPSSQHQATATSGRIGLWSVRSVQKVLNAYKAWGCTVSKISWPPDFSLARASRRNRIRST